MTAITVQQSGIEMQQQCLSAQLPYMKLQILFVLHFRSGSFGDENTPKYTAQLASALH